MTPQTIIAVFDNLQQSDNAFKALVANGSDPEEISVAVAKGHDAPPAVETDALRRQRLRLRAGIVGSFALGGAIGALLGSVGAYLTLDLGPMALVGPVTALMGGVLGICGGGFVSAVAEGALAGSKTQGAEEGRLLGEVVLTVRTCSNVAAHVEELLRREGAREIERRNTGTPTLVAA